MPLRRAFAPSRFTARFGALAMFCAIALSVGCSAGADSGTGVVAPDPAITDDTGVDLPTDSPASDTAPYDAPSARADAPATSRDAAPVTTPPASDGGSGGVGDAGGGGLAADVGGAADAPETGGSFGSVGTGGAQDFAAFRAALDAWTIPSPSTLDANGFYAEHYTTLPPPTCTQTFCLHGMMSFTDDLARGGSWTLLQMAMNSPLDPTTVKRPALDLAVVLDHSGSMSMDSKLAYAKQGVAELIDAMTDQDTLTLIAFDTHVDTLFGPAKVTDKAALKEILRKIVPADATNIYDALETGYKAALGAADETKQRRVIFLTDGIANIGKWDPVDIEAMSASYNEKYIGLTTIGLGADADGTLLRKLAERGSGNYYFVESPAAVTEVFTEELAYFVAPIAYDLDLTFTEEASYSVREMYGSNLWTPFATGGGGTVHVPSVFLVSRTSSAPGAGGGRRGGGSAIIADLTPSIAAPTVTPFPVASLKLRYRLPGSTKYEEQKTQVTYGGLFGAPPAAGYYSDPAIEKNTLILDYFVAFRDATKTAQTDPKAALTFLQAFAPRITARLKGWTDEDLVDDGKILDEYIAVLKKVTGAP